MNKITIIDVNTSSVLNSYSLDDEELALAQAVEYEKLELEIKVVYPNSIEQLGNALGASHKAIEKLRCEMNQEIESH